MSLEELPMQPAGMMLWLGEILSEGMPVKTLVVMANVLVPSLLVALMVLSVVVIQGFSGGTLFLGSFILLLLYVAAVFKGYQFLSDGRARLAWFQKPFWIGLLMYFRYRRWRGFDSRFRNRNVVDFRDQPITDDQLPKLASIRAAQVLDLEGTLITDKTIETFYGLKHLQCLVVRNTDATHLAVTRLQQTHPKIWIWH